MATLRLPIIIEEDEAGFVVECPSFQGCYTQGGTYEEAMENIRDLIHLHLQRGHVPATREIRNLSVSTIEIEA